MNLAEIAKEFDTEEKCIAYLERTRWPEGVRCLKCGSMRISRFQTKGKTGKIRHLYQCLACRYQFSATTGTIFHDSHLPLQKWFTAIALVYESKDGISANKLRQVLDVQYKTAWNLARRIREAMQTGALQQFQREEEALVSQVSGPGGKGMAGAPPELASGAIAASDQQRSISQPRRTSLKGKPAGPEPARAEVPNMFENVWTIFKRGLMGPFYNVSVKQFPHYMSEFTALLAALIAVPTEIPFAFAKGLQRTIVRSQTPPSSPSSK